MATSKTGSFWLTEVVQLPPLSVSGDRVQGSIDLGAYVDVGDQQAVSIEQVDFIWQAGDDYGSDPAGLMAANGSLGAQLSDLNPGTAFLRADDNSLIASGSLALDRTNSVTSHSADFYPDSFGKLDESRFVVNDTLYLVAGVDGNDTGAAVDYCTVRIKARIVKLSTKDWMAIAIQSTASDN
jgi:hypothetical protein